ncbi:synemin-like [Sinocyclocheilus anshuiensis]|uniref:synemin-like n=1 Tax=Sinocyclocheilus anshuiensis TaxID=1608454 RepID=UPI0007B869CE|nr:PREDICTED: synemin-like [Sinocyclocheilus anshuiensis]
MFRMREPFESEKLQLQELNQRLSQYLMRAKHAKQLEQENTSLISEINSIRKNRSGEWENKHMSELREMRRLVERLSFEKCRAEMERQKLRNELQILQAMRSEEASVSKGVDTELKGCERHLHNAFKTNSALEDHLIELENEYKFLEDAHRKEIAHLRDQVHSRTVRVVTQTYHAPPAVTMEEVQEYAANFTESWQGTLDMYRLKVEKIEESIKADQARLDDIQREKREYASQFKRLRDEIEKQTNVQLNLEEQLMNMQENFRAEICKYQAIIEELEYERRMLSNTISEKLKDHQDLLQVKMGLALEVAAYRALLEEEGRHAQTWSTQHSRERIIDIKMPAHPYTPRVSVNSASRPDTRKKAFTDVKYMEPTSSLRTSSTSSQFHSYEPSRIVPISVSNRAQQSPASRRDMISFTKAVQAAASSTPKPGVSSVEIKREETDQRIMRKEISQPSSKGSLDHTHSRIESTHSSTASKTEKPKPVKVISPPASLSKTTTEEKSQKDVEPKAKGMDAKQDKEKSKVTMEEERRDVKESIAKDEKESENVGHKVFVGEEKVLDAVSMKEIIQQVMKPAGLDAKVSSSPDSKVTYHVEKTEQENGTTKTQIFLQSKVEEEVDLSDDSALEELLSMGVKKVTLENIKGTPTGTMIENLLSLGLQGENLENRLVNVEIIEEPVESVEEGEIEIEETVEIKSKQPNIDPSSMFFQIEELESNPKTMKPDERGSAEASQYGDSGSVQVREVTRDESLPYFSHGQDSQEYFVSTPEDNMSESEEGGRFMSYSHYGVVDDLSDERYYQEDDPKHPTAEGHSYRESPEYEHSFLRDNIQDCIIEEEVHVSPTLQQSIVGILRKDSLDPEQQLRGALEQIQDTVSGALKEELAFFTKGRETPENVSVDIKKVEQVTDNGTMTIVAQLNVSQTLEESGLLEREGDDLSEEQIMAALSSSHPKLQQAIGGGAGVGYTMKISQEEIQIEGMPWMTGDEEIQQWSSTDEAGKTEKHIKLGPSEKSFTFQMDVNNSSSASASGGAVEVQRGGGATEFPQTQMIDPHLKVCHEKRIATVYLESPKE